MVSMSNAKPEKKTLPKRFYAAVNLQHNGEGFAIMLDGKNVRTPMGKLLQCASQQLAQQICAEWEAQVEVINADLMPLTRLLNIALDRVEMDRAALLADIANYCETDLLFYRAPLKDSALPIDSPNEKLRQLQLQHFEPILEWVATQHGLQFVVTDGVMPVPQPEASVQKLLQHFASANGHELTALAMLVPILGSALLALALWQGEMSIEQGLIASRLDEAVQAEQWGEDAETVAKWDAKCRDARAAAFFLTYK